MDQDDEHYQPTPEELQKFRAARLARVMAKYSCNQERAQSFIDLREEGHAPYQAAVMAGLADPVM